MTWGPSATIKTLQKRAEIITRIRQFFAARQVLEVDTPLLCHGTVTDPHVIGIPAIFKEMGSDQQQIMYLQTSPEYAMKRLLAAGSGPIYQICKAFRQGEVGKIHNPEFTMLEWYRPDFDHHALMDEMDEFLMATLHITTTAERWSYAQAFKNYLEIDPQQVHTDELQKLMVKKEIVLSSSAIHSKDDYLDLLFNHCIEPFIGHDRPLFLYDFPASQAALAKIHPSNPAVAARFEVYFKGVELANGYYELLDAEEHRKRFTNDLAYRAQHGIPHVPIDHFFLTALEHGIPDCAGVALGIDRLVMLALDQEKIADVLTFEFWRA